MIYLSMIALVALNTLEVTRDTCTR